MHSGYSIGELAKRAGCNHETVRYYERRGIMPKPGRSAGGHRVYEDHHAGRLSFILRAREMGFPLNSVQELLTLVDRGDYSCEEAQGIATVHLRNLRKKIADLHKLEETLVDLVKTCESGTKPDCAFIQELFRPRMP